MMILNQLPRRMWLPTSAFGLTVLMLIGCDRGKSQPEGSERAVDSISAALETRLPSSLTGVASTSNLRGWLGGVKIHARGGQIAADAPDRVFYPGPVRVVGAAAEQPTTIELAKELVTRYRWRGLVGAALIVWAMGALLAWGLRRAINKEKSPHVPVSSRQVPSGPQSALKSKQATEPVGRRSFAHQQYSTETRHDNAPRSEAALVEAWRQDKVAGTSEDPQVVKSCGISNMFGIVDFGWLPAVVVAVAIVILVALLGEALLRVVPGIPYNIEELFDGDFRIGRLLSLSTAALLLASPSVIMARFTVVRSIFAFLLPLGFAGASASAYLLLRATVPEESLFDLLGVPILGWPWDCELLGRFVALALLPQTTLYVAALPLFACATDVSFRNRGWSCLAGVAMCLVLIGIAHFVVVNRASTNNVTELLADKGNSPRFLLLWMLFLMMACNAALFCFAWPRWNRWLVPLLIATPLLSLPGYGLLSAGLEQKLEKYGKTFSAQQFLLSPSREEYQDERSIIAKWSIVQTGSVLLLALFQLPGHIACQRRKSAGADGRPAALQPESIAVSRDPATHLRAGSPNRRHYAGLALMYTVLAIYGSLVPLEYIELELKDALQRFSEIRLLSLGITSRADVVANLLLFIPLAFLWNAALSVDSKHPGVRFLFALLVVCFSVALCTAIEFTQLWFPNRTVSLNDIFAESSGAVVGAGLWLFLGQQFTVWVRRYLGNSNVADTRIWLLQAYAAGLVINSVMPLDLTIHPTELYHKYQEGKILLIPFSHSYSSPFEFIYNIATDVALFVPVGALIAVYFGRGTRGNLLRCSLVGVLVVVAIEAMQLLVYSRFVDSTDLLTETIGVVIGAFLMMRYRPATERDAVRSRPVSLIHFGWLAAAIAWCVVLCLGFWSPFDFAFDKELLRDRLEGFFRVPFSSLYAGNDFNAIVQMTRKTLLFCPLGAFLVLSVPPGASTNGIRRFVLALLIAASSGVAFGIELGQVLQPTKIADMTDALIGSFGALLGIGISERYLRQIQKHEPQRSPMLTRETQPASHRPTGRSTLYPGLYGLRALASVAVFVTNFVAYGPFDPEPDVLRRVRPFGNTGVAFFFTLSGCLLSLPLWRGAPSNRCASALRGFVKQRFIRLAPAYLICLSILVIFKQHFRTPTEIWDTVLHVLFLHNLTDFSFYGISPQFWTIGVQAQFYLVFALTVWFAGRLSNITNGRLVTIFLGLCIVSYGVHSMIMQTVPKVVPWPFDPAILSPTGTALERSLLAHLPLFFLGVVGGWLFVAVNPVSQKHQPAASLKWDGCFWISSIGLLLVLGTPVFDALEIPYARYRFPFVPGLLLILIITIPRTRFAARLLEIPPLGMLGRVSYGVYIYHLTCITVVSRLLAHTGSSVAQDSWFVAPASFAATVVIAMVSHFTFERWVIKRWSNSGPRPQNSFPAPDVRTIAS